MDYIKNELKNLLKPTLEPVEIEKRIEKCENIRLGAIAAAVGVIGIGILLNVSLFCGLIISAIAVVTVHDTSIMMTRIKGFAAEYFQRDMAEKMKILINGTILASILFDESSPWPHAHAHARKN